MICGITVSQPILVKYSAAHTHSMNFSGKETYCVQQLTYLHNVACLVRNTRGKVFSAKDLSLILLVIYLS